MSKTPPPVAQPKSWHERVSHLLEAAGLNEVDRAIWLSAGSEDGWSAEGYARELIVWQQKFCDAAVAKAWFDSRLCLEDAAEWHRSGYTAEETVSIVHELFRLVADQGVPAALAPDLGAFEKAWRSSRLPARWVVACLRLGIIDVDASRQLFDAGQP
ncbi:MAG: hypothetical protein NVSMB48_09220 [Marmoricola sp.]